MPTPACPKATPAPVQPRQRARVSASRRPCAWQRNGALASNSRLRFESALGSLYEAQAGIRLAVAWGYIAEAATDELLASMPRLGGRIYGLVRK
jgi:hypothetical protein